MRKIALIKDGTVENIATWDGESLWSPDGENVIDVTGIYCDIGMTYKNGRFFSEDKDESEKLHKEDKK